MEKKTIRINELLKTYGGNQLDPLLPVITFKDGLCLLLNYMNLEDEIKRLEQFEIKAMDYECKLETLMKFIKKTETYLWMFKNSLEPPEEEKAKMTHAEIIEWIKKDRPCKPENHWTNIYEDLCKILKGAK